ncbi:multiheme c-type cytochrome [Armatimonas rosea]|uniref:Cytochrome c-552/4 domain-containing protein n=1 Tax=Armatimonas rosea TaxID=685828 RepID=A0A7W9ST57_ARMRO|nr:multiheme c-type cytochrome [Armatimonas rosea]MBB6052385.1 hypothetical protein [Armatimonas rosea]
MIWRLLGPLALLVCLLLAPGCQQEAPPVASPTPLPTAAPPVAETAASLSALDEAEFVGTPACSPCHAELAKTHGESRHMRTLRRAVEGELGELTPPVGKIPGTPFSLKRAEGRFVLAGGKVALPLHLAFGSGKTGVTYATAFADGTLTELHKSYFVSTKTWYTTPGQEKVPSTAPGDHVPGAIARKCVLCHAVTLPPDRLGLEKRFIGVGCEACHGPGSAHVAAAEAGKPSKALIEGLKAAPGSVVLETCGKCHRTAATIDRNDPVSSQQTQRFQPYGLSLSKCFQKSADKLSCVTCHNPHEDASTDTKRYEAVCVSCHAAPKTVCPVNPKEKCVSCHMPTRQVFAGTTIPTKMADHFIRVFKK